MKNLIKNILSFLGFAVLWFGFLFLVLWLIGCHPTPERTAHQPFTDSVVINPACEIEAPSEPRIAMRAANIPDFWDTTYKANKLIRLYIEADTLFRALYKDSTESAIRARVNLMNRVCEPMYGIRFEIVQLVIRTRSDQTYRATAATPMLYAWTTEYPTLDPNLFKLRISGKNIGGSAYLSRGSVTSAKWAVVGMGFVPMGNVNQPGKLEYNMTHEIFHNCGLSHAFNCCVYLDRSGKQLGRLDSTWPGERTCSPSPTCRTTTKRHNSGLLGYGHVYNSQQWTLHPAIRKVLMESLFYSTVPSYTPNQPQPITTSWTFSGTTYAGTQTNCTDGDTTTRWVASGHSSLTATFSAQRQVNNLTIWTGFLKDGKWGDPVRSIQVWADGEIVWVGGNQVRLSVPVNRSCSRIEIRGLDSDFNRWREVRVDY